MSAFFLKTLIISSKLLQFLNIKPPNTLSIDLWHVFNDIFSKVKKIFMLYYINKIHISIFSKNFNLIGLKSNNNKKKFLAGILKCKLL